MIQSIKDAQQQSFLQSFTWVWVMLLFMGLLFAGVALAVQLVPMSPQSITYTRNGVLQPPTEETLRAFRSLFLLAFGVPGVLLLTAGGIVGGRAHQRKKLAAQLRKEGTCLQAAAQDFVPSNVRINHHPVLRLRCAYTDAGGITYLFRSDYLRYDPLPYLPNGLVRVYVDVENPRRYFVDIDGSVQANHTIVEL